MNKKQFAVIGHPIGHTMSPFIHKRLFEISKVNADYEAYDISPYDISRAFDTLKSLDGYNVTIPHKYSIVSYMDSLSKRSAKYRSVNTVENKDGKSIGHSTDPDGFLQSLEYEKIPLEGRVIIIGAGGVARILAYESAMAGCSTVIAARSSSLMDAAILAGDIKSNVIKPQVETCLIDNLKGHIDLLINATPCGMFPKIDECPVTEEIIKDCSYVFDAIYNPYETKLVRLAHENGAKAVGGLPMLVIQAAASQQIWTGATFSNDDITQVINDAREEMEKLFGK